MMIFSCLVATGFYAQTIEQNIADRRVIHSLEL
jgi:hypothetical protein